MRYTILGKVADGGWSMTVEAPSAEAALSQALASDPGKHGQRGPAYEITVYPEIGGQAFPQIKGYENCAMSMPQPLMSLYRGSQPYSPLLVW